MPGINWYVPKGGGHTPAMSTSEPAEETPLLVDVRQFFRLATLVWFGLFVLAGGWALYVIYSSETGGDTMPEDGVLWVKVAIEGALLPTVALATVWGVLGRICRKKYRQPYEM